LDDIRSAISVWGKAWTSTAITKLKSALRDNQEFRKEMVKRIEEYSWKDILWQIAGLQMSPLVPKWLAGVWVWLWVWGGYLASMLDPTFIWSLLLTSPRLVWEVANALGVWVWELNRFVDKVKSFIPKAKNVWNNSANSSNKLNILSNWWNKKVKQIF
jgi:hypothetical protein